jgi:hypothetical protein
MDMNNEEDVEKLLQGMLIDQTIGTKQLENPEYFGNRYRNPAVRSVMEAHDGYRMAISSTVTTNLYFNDIVINPILSLPRPYPPELGEIQALREQYERTKMERVVAAKGNSPAEKTVDFPILDSMIPCCGKNVADIRKFTPESYRQLENYYNYVVANVLLQAGTKNTQGLKEAVMKTREAIYIDGKPFVDFLQERYPKGISNGLIGVTAVTAILGGKHTVDIVNAYRNEDGEMQYEARTIRSAVTPEQEELYMQQYSWFRRTFFNWGPFRIETLQEKLDRIVNDPNTEDRLAIVTAEQKARIEAGITRQAEKELQAKLEQERDAARREAFEQEAKRVVDSTAQWDKNSAIGILGQQIAGTWKTNNGPVDGVCQAIRTDLAMTTVSKRYATIAMPLAKMMLYSQLCSDRAANNGEPGEIEKILGMGDAKTIAESIHNTAAKMAADPILKSLFQDKVGVLIGKEICLDSVNFEKMIGSSGVDRFRMEYMQKLQEMANQKDQQAPTNELEMENQKQQDMQKAPM